MDDGMAVQVVSITEGGSLWTGTGHVLDEDGIASPDLITFGGDWRMMRDIKWALERDEEPIAIVPGWAVLGRIPA